MTERIAGTLFAAIMTALYQRQRTGQGAMVSTSLMANGRWFLLNALTDDRDWPKLLQAIERPNLLDDPRFAATPARRADARALVPSSGRITRSNS